MPGDAFYLTLDRKGRQDRDKDLCVAAAGLLPHINSSWRNQTKYLHQGLLCYG